MNITFNTGRLYTALGQVITAEDQGNRVLFKDHSRGICGEIMEVFPGALGSNPERDARWVMARYDRREYQMSVEAINLEQSLTIHNVKL